MIFDEISFGLAQINPIVGDIKGNARMILDAAKSIDCDLLVFPELCVSGYMPEDLVLHDYFINTVHEVVETEIVPHIATDAIISAPWKMGDDIYNVAILIEDNTIKAIIPKRKLPNYSIFDERRVFAEGELSEPVPYKNYSLGILTCEDLWTPEVSADLARLGADILVCTNGSPFSISKQMFREELVKERARETKLPVIYVNCIGGQDEYVFDGHSFVVGADQNIICRFPPFETRVDLVTNDHVDNENNENDLILKALEMGLRDYVVKNGFKQVLLGLSGGIDSAISAVIACNALGAENVQCIMMPSDFTSSVSLEDAKALAENLGCHYEIIPVKDAVNLMEGLTNPSALAHENLQSRLRGLILMTKSNTNGALVLSTGNKSEMAVGYATLYGDMCGAFNVLKDVYKTKVYELSRHINTGKEIIPDRIITRPPSAELRADQTDQDSLPDYPDLDAILEGMIEDRLDNKDIIAKGYDRDTVIRVRTLLNRSEYKRKQAPPGVKITTHSFGRERRMPITNRYHDEA